jgi:hypothetical protein
MVDDLNAITIKIEDCSIEDTIVASSEGGRSVGLTASGQRSRIEVPHRRFAGRGKCHMCIAAIDTVAVLVSQE